MGRPDYEIRDHCVTEIELSDEDLIVIPLPTHHGGVTYAVARLVREREGVFAEAIVAVPETNFAPPQRVALSARSLAQIKPGAPAHRPNLYFYEGMILPPPPGTQPRDGLH